MRYKLPGLLLLLAVFPVTALLMMHAPFSVAAARAPTDDTRSVTVIILDMSGSMSANDPRGIRCAATDAYIRLSGPGDSIGVVGLDNNNGATAGSLNLQAAMDWQDPVEMDTQRAKVGLISTISQKSDHCRPDGHTPTYNALSTAETMLANSAKQGITNGQVILLTDGAPYPQPGFQVNAIDTDLVPLFQQYGWPINTIALGADSTDQGTDYHSFLAGLSRATSGGTYDDSKGPVTGVSPLNITPFFLDIFERFHSRVLNLDIPYTTLEGNTYARNFSVANYANELDVLVMKDNPSLTGVLRDPGGQVVNSSIAGVTVVNESYFLLISVTSPSPGQWELDLSGPPGSHMMVYDLTASSLGVAITSVSTAGVNQNLSGGKNTLPLGATLTVTAHLTSNGVPLSSPDFVLNGVLTYEGTSGVFQQSFSLQPRPGGAYQGTVPIPNSAPVGSYTVKIALMGVSGTRPLAQSPEFAFRVALFPTALFIRCVTLSSVRTCAPTPNAVSTVAPRWDLGLQLLYSLPGVSWLGRWALNSSTSQPVASVNGQVLVGDQPYSGATVFGSAQEIGSNKTLPLTIEQQGGSNFTASFVPTSAGTYVVTLDVRGSLQNTTGDLAVVKRDVAVAFAGATGGEELLAWLKTAVYLFILAGIVALGNFTARPEPYVIVTEGNRPEPERPEPARVRVNNLGDLFRRVLLRNQVDSSQLGLGPGMMIRFQRDDDNRRQIMWVRETQRHSEWLDGSGAELFKRKDWTRLGSEREVRRGLTRFLLKSRKPRKPRTRQKTKRKK